MNEEKLMRKLYHACLHAYQWHCGNGTEKAEKDCMDTLSVAIEDYQGYTRTVLDSLEKKDRS